MTNLTQPLPTTVAPFGDDDPRVTFARAVALADPVIAAVRPDQLDHPTPCTEMDVHRLLGHLVMAAGRVRAAGRGDDPSTFPDEVTGLTPDELLAAWRTTVHEIQPVWADDALLDRMIELPWATMPGRAVLGVYTNEITVHTWDLARATGQHPAWDDDVIAASLAAMEVALPAEGRIESFAAIEAALPPGAGWTPPFGPAIEVGKDATPIERLVAWNGRQP